MRKLYNIILVGLIVIGLISSITVLIGRARFESDYKTVTIALDYFQLHKLARYSGYDINSLLDTLKSRGFDTVAVLEDTPEFLEERGIAAVVKGYNIEKKVLEGPDSARKKEKPIIERVTEDKLAASSLGLAPNQNHLIFKNSHRQLALKLADSWKLRLAENLVSVHEFEDEGVIVITLEGDSEEIYQLGAGFISGLSDDLKDRGFQVLPRLRNNRNLDESETRNVLADPALTDSVLICDGDEVSGYPALLNTVASELKSHNTIFGYVEFAKQDGDKALGNKTLPLTVRVHSISDEEMEIYNPGKAVDRYLRAVRERSVRIVYLKPFFLHAAGDDLIDKNISYFQNVRDSIVKDEYQIGGIKPFERNAPGRTQNLLILLAISAGFLLLLSFGWNIRSWILLVMLFLVSIVVCTKSPDSMFFKLFGLLDAISFPVIGLAWIFTYKSPSEKVIFGFVNFLVVILFTIAGGLMIAALFSTTSYMLEMDSFSGVKISFILPVFLVALIGVRLFFRDEKKSFLKEVIFLGDFEIRVKHLFFLLIIAFAGLIILMRSGNEPIFAVSSLENTFRGLLEDFFTVRPRTKEFLIGHPLLITALLLRQKYSQKLSSLVFICLVGGIIGQVSALNTFCHFHTPLNISIVRTAYGLIAGLLLGLVFYLLVTISAQIISRITQK
jgi:glycosyltransferase involved in cell wall biosynthesis